MDFFEHQEIARKKTHGLIFLLLLAVTLIICAVYLATSLCAYFLLPNPKQIPINWWQPELFLWVAAITFLLVFSASMFKFFSLRGGGESVAASLGGNPIQQNTKEFYERRALNVVEEMALASGISVPPVYLLSREKSINAFAAGTQPDNAVIGLTKGTIEKLNRQELQGVIAHEFSHILNGDMRLNLRLLGLVSGIIFIGMTGLHILRFAPRGTRSHSKDSGNAFIVIFLFGALLAAIGYIGVFFAKLIKASVSRQREYLADASAVQFTRETRGIAGALKKLGNRGSRIRHNKAEEISHMFFGNALKNSFSQLLATHPPLLNRILRMEPDFKGVFTAESFSESSSDNLAFQFLTSERKDEKKISPINRVGSLEKQHVEYALHLISDLPAQVKEHVRDPYGACAVIYALFLDTKKEIRTKQLLCLETKDTLGIKQFTKKLFPVVQEIPAKTHLPLVDLAIPALLQLIPDQYELFRENLEYLLEADQEIDLFEFCLHRIITRNIEQRLYPQKIKKIKIHRIRGIFDESITLLSALAYQGSTDREKAETTFFHALKILGISTSSVVIRPPEECTLFEIDAALERMVNISPQLKKRFLNSCAECIGMDQKITIEEAELFRAIGETLQCPVPVFVGEV